MRTWLFRISEPGYIDRVERRLPTAFAGTVMMLTSSSSEWKVMYVRLAVEAHGVVNAEKAFVVVYCIVL